MKSMCREKQNQEMGRKSWSYCLFLLVEQRLKPSLGIFVVGGNLEVDFCYRYFYDNTEISQAVTYFQGLALQLITLSVSILPLFCFNIKTEHRSTEYSLRSGCCLLRGLHSRNVHSTISWWSNGHSIGAA